MSAMKDAGYKDFYDVRLDGLVSSLSYAYLGELYLPLAGPAATGVYLGMLHDPYLDDESLHSHGEILERLRVSPGQWRTALERLEALGLLKTKMMKDKDRSVFHYCLIPPKEPREFFADVLLSGTLRKYAGEDYVKGLQEKYAAKNELYGYEDVTSSFQSVFRPDFDDPVFLAKNDGKIVSEAGGKLKTDFDLSAFINFVQKNGIPESSLSKNDKDHFEKLATLYGIEPEAMGEIAIRFFNPQAKLGSRFDYDRIDEAASDTLSFPFLRGKNGRSAVHGDSAMAEKIRMMDKMTPTAWLKMISGNRRPPNSDLKIINHLSVDLGLGNGVVNALIDYVLSTNDNILSMNYCDKLAGSLQRAGIDNARDAMEYLNSVQEKRSDYRKKNKSSGGYSPKRKQEKPLSQEQIEEEEASDEEVNSALSRLYNK